MRRREFIRAMAAAGGGYAVSHRSISRASGSILLSSTEEGWFDRPMRWAQLTLVENDPGRYDPDFWLDYFRRIHADGACLSAGGIVAYYPTEIPLHHRSDWLGSSDPLGYLMDGCREMGMAIILRTDPHAARQDVYDAHPDWIAVTEDGEKRRHWAAPELWVTCGLGPYNFEFMTLVHDEIMERYRPDAIFSNRWAGSGMCYCEHCRRNFRDFAGLELPRGGGPRDPTRRRYEEWRIERLKELWFLWDGRIRSRDPNARFIPNGFPDRVLTGQLSDIFFTDYQARSGSTPLWNNGRVAKQLRATLGMKPLGGIFSVGLEERNRWKDSVQSEAEMRVWVAEGTANGMRPWFTKFGGVLYDRRWLDRVAAIYELHHRCEPYLRNTAPIARVGVVYSEHLGQVYGNEEWQGEGDDHVKGVYHALVEDRMPFEMVNDRLLDPAHLAPFKLLVLPNNAALSAAQCEQLRAFIRRGGSLLATFATSLFDEEGRARPDFGLSDVFGVSYAGAVEGRMQNSYLRLKGERPDGRFHPILRGLEDAYRIINGSYRVEVRPNHTDFPAPVTLIPSYPDLPMEYVYPREPETGIREVYLREVGQGRVAYIPWDLDRTYWQILNVDHGRLLRNIVRWALAEEPVVTVQGPGIVDVTAWRQERSVTVHLVNLTNPMMMKGPFRELLPIGEQTLSIGIPAGVRVTGVQLLVSQQRPSFEVRQDRLTVVVPGVVDSEIVAVDLV
jgi:Hypothetical glycosyl hydrolase 6